VTEHTLFGGKLHIYKRPNSSLWQCSAYIGGKNRRESTKTDSLAQAKDFAEDWYLGLKVKYKAGELTDGKAFEDAATQFLREYEEAIAAGGAVWFLGEPPIPCKAIQPHRPAHRLRSPYRHNVDNLIPHGNLRTSTNVRDKTA
jgi:hypothetical protein